MQCGDANHCAVQYRASTDLPLSLSLLLSLALFRAPTTGNENDPSTKPNPCCRTKNSTVLDSDHGIISTALVCCFFPFPFSSSSFSFFVLVVVTIRLRIRLICISGIGAALANDPRPFKYSRNKQGELCCTMIPMHRSRLGLSEIMRTSSN